MGFWLFMLVASFLIPLTMIGFGNLFWKKPPENINSTFGYRTTRSMKNQDTWEFAHRYCGKLWVQMGWIMLLLSGAGMLLVVGKNTNTVALVGTIFCFLQIIPMFLSIFLTERAINQNFHADGTRRKEL